MSSRVSVLLSRARDSLEDARLLAERRRPNEAVLARLALHQALQAVSVAQGLDAEDGLRLDTLFRRVPEDHPEAARIAGLRDEAAQTIAAVSELVQALSEPEPQVEVRPKPDARQPPRSATAAGSGRDPAGPTAFAASPQGGGRAGPADSLTSATFWTLMDRWRVADLDALALIGHGGGLTRKGTRPRFRLVGEEAARQAALRRLDGALEALGIDPSGWLRAVRKDPPFRGETPLAALTRDGEPAARQLLRLLNRQGLASALTAPPG